MEKPGTRSPLPPTNHKHNAQDLAFGAAALKDTKQGWETAVIIDYSPSGQTYRIRSAQGRLTERCARMTSVPGEISIIPRGTTVVINHELGFPCIIGILNGANMAPNAEETVPTRVTEVTGIGGEDNVYVTPQDGNGRSPNAPMDVIGDDWLRQTRDGNFLAALAGGVNIMKSGGMSQVRTNALEELVEILSHRFKHVTGMGNLDIQSENGKTSLIWRAGADQSTETGANRGFWTVRLDVGATGDLFNLEVTTPQGQSLARFHISSEGRIEITGVGGIDLTSGSRGTTEEVVDHDKNILITGNRTTEVNETETVKVGSRETKVSNGDSAIIGGPRSVAVSGDDLALLLGNQKSRVYKDVIFDYLQGAVGIHLGNVGLGGVPLAGKAFNVINQSGDINFAVMNPASRFAVISSAPGSVLLGASGSAIYNPLTGLYTVVPVAPFGVVLFEPLASLLGTMCAWIDSHFHLSAVGPTSPGAASPLGPISTLVLPSVNTLRSQRVWIGA